MSSEEFQFLKDVCKEYRKNRIEQMSERIKFVSEALTKENITFRIVNEDTGQFNVKVNGKTYTFYAGTGKIIGREERGYKNFIKFINSL